MKAEGRRQKEERRDVGASRQREQRPADLRYTINDLRAEGAEARKSYIVNHKWWALIGALLLFSLLTGVTLDEQRFPPPDFEGGHQLPVTTTPAARAVLLQYLDVAVLAASLALASWLVYKRRSRKGLMALSILSL